MNDSLFRGVAACRDQVAIKDADDCETLGHTRWNETLVSVGYDTRMPAWKWQLWAETRGEVEVTTVDGTLCGFIWPRQATVSV